MRGVPENDEQREELVDGLQYRIHKEQAILKHRLTPLELERTKTKRSSRSRRASKSRRTGKLYQVFQALSYDEEN
jgi:hypothetical protein